MKKIIYFGLIILSFQNVANASETYLFPINPIDGINKQQSWHKLPEAFTCLKPNPDELLSTTVTTFAHDSLGHKLNGIYIICNGIHGNNVELVKAGHTSDKCTVACGSGQYISWFADSEPVFRGAQGTVLFQFSNK